MLRKQVKQLVRRRRSFLRRWRFDGTATRVEVIDGRRGQRLLGWHRRDIVRVVLCTRIHVCTAQASRTWVPRVA